MRESGQLGLIFTYGLSKALRWNLGGKLQQEVHILKECICYLDDCFRLVVLIPISTTTAVISWLESFRELAASSTIFSQSRSLNDESHCMLINYFNNNKHNFRHKWVAIWISLRFHKKFHFKNNISKYFLFNFYFIQKNNSNITGTANRTYKRAHYTLSRANNAARDYLQARACLKLPPPIKRLITRPAMRSLVYREDGRGRTVQTRISLNLLKFYIALRLSDNNNNNNNI